MIALEFSESASILLNLKPNDTVHLQVFSKEVVSTMFPIATSITVEVQSDDFGSEKCPLPSILSQMCLVHLNQPIDNSFISPSFQITEIKTCGEKTSETAIISSQTKVKYISAAFEDLQSDANCAGLDAEFLMVKEIINRSKSASFFPKLQIKPPRGALLYGPPGTGKTLLAKSIATKLNLSIVVIDTSVFYGKYYGDSEKMVKNYRKAEFYFELG